MLIELANRNDDLRRLIDKGYALRVDGSHLVVRDIPYLDGNGALQVGAFVTVLVPIDQFRMKQQDHQVYFAGSVPHGLDGKPIPNLGGGAANVLLAKTDVVVQRSFSNKPVAGNGFANFFDKIEHYTKLISGPAIERYGANPFTHRIDPDVVSDSHFKFQDSLSARAEIGDLAAVFKQDVVAIIGLGGTGAYLLDLFVKTPVMEIRGFDGDEYHIHNAYRSPGKLAEDELDKSKADVYRDRYDNFHKRLFLHKKYIDRSSAEDLEGVTFAFVCVDKGTARAEIFDLLISLGIPFIDVGMGLNRKQGALAGTVRTTYFAADKAAETKAMGLAELVDDPDDLYRKNVQIAELNALNACIAMIRYKQLRGFYVDDNSAYHLLMNFAQLRMFAEPAQ